MKRLLNVTIVCLVLTGGFTFGAIDPNVSFSLVNSGSTTSGSYSPSATFTLTLNGTWSGFTSNGYSLWLEINSALAPYITITNETYFTFAGSTDTGFPKAFTDTSGGTNSGFRTDHDTVINPQTGSIDSGDLGATGAGVAAGTHQLASLTFQLSGAPVGTYTLETATAGPKSSEFGDTSFTSHFAASDAYTITVVPEPATLSLLGLGGLGSLVLRYRRKK